MAVAAAGMKIFIAPAVTEAQADSTAEFAAMTWTEIGEVTTVPEYGDESANVESSDLGGNRVRKSKGTRNAGDTSIVVNWNPADLGQQALLAAEATNFKYPIKVEKPDKLNPTGTNSIDYFRAIVRSARQGGGDANSILTMNFAIGIDSQIYKVAATAGV